MNKTSPIDFSADRLIAIAADCVEEHNYISALKMLNKNAVLNGNDEDSFMLYAETFDDMGLYEKCVNGWFKYIDYAAENADLAEAYEGLAISFMNMGQEGYAAYYYRLLLETDAELTPESRQEILESFVSKEKNKLKFVYPPALVDYSEAIENGISRMRENDYESAVAEFSKVDENSEKYLAARNYIAMCNVITDNCEQAEQECIAILRRNPQNVEALTTLAAVKTQQKKTEEAKALAERLLSLNATAQDDIYKIATVCCENKMHKQAYELLSGLEGELAYDSSILFFKAIAAYNSGYPEKSLEIFDLLLTIYPNAITADYWRSEVAENASKPLEERAELEYFYRLPAKLNEANLGLLAAFVRLSDKAAAKFCKEADIECCVRWCFDEGDGRNNGYELRILGGACAVKAGLDDAVRDILLDSFVQDGIKLETLSTLVRKNAGGEYGIVICNIYKRLTLVPLAVGRKMRNAFLKAYGFAFSRFAIISPDYGYLLNASATKLYAKLESENRLEDARSVPSLAAAIIKFSGINESGLTERALLSFFGADAQKVNKILGD